jgi:hypothetical protein
MFFITYYSFAVRTFEYQSLNIIIATVENVHDKLEIFCGESFVEVEASALVSRLEEVNTCGEESHVNPSASTNLLCNVSDSREDFEALLWLGSKVLGRNSKGSIN